MNSPQANNVSNPQTLGSLFKLIIRNLPKRIMKNLPVMIIVAVLSWLVHTIILVGPNGGFDPDTWLGNNILNVRGKMLSSTLLWAILGGIFTSMISSIIQGRNPFANFVDMFKIPGKIISKNKETNNKLLPVILIAMGVSLLFDKLLSGFASIIFGGVVLTSLTAFITGRGGIFTMIIRSIYFDVQSYILKKKNSSLDNDALLLVMGSSGIVLIIFGFLRTTNLFFRILSFPARLIPFFQPLFFGIAAVINTILAWAWAIFIIVGIIIYAVKRSPNKQDMTKTMVFFGLFFLTAMTVQKLTGINIFADDGGWAEAGGTFKGWLVSEGAFEAVMRGLLPALGGILGSNIAGIISGMNLNDLFTGGGGFTEGTGDFTGGGDYTEGTGDFTKGGDYTESGGEYSEGADEYTEGADEGTAGADDYTEGGDEGAAGADEDTEGADEDTEGADEDTEGADEDTEGADEDTEGADEDTEGADEDTEGADEDTEGADEDAEGADEDTEGADEDTEGADEDTEGGDEDTEGADEDTEGADEDTEGADEDTEGADEDAEGADEDTEGADEDTEGADEDTEGADEDTEGADEDTEGADEDTEGADEDAEGADEDTQPETEDDEETPSDDEKPPMSDEERQAQEEEMKRQEEERQRQEEEKKRQEEERKRREEEEKKRQEEEERKRQEEERKRREEEEKKRREEEERRRQEEEDARRKIEYINRLCEKYNTTPDKLREVLQRNIDEGLAGYERWKKIENTLWWAEKTCQVVSVGADVAIDCMASVGGPGAKAVQAGYKVLKGGAANMADKGFTLQNFAGGAVSGAFDAATDFISNPYAKAATTIVGETAGGAITGGWEGAKDGFVNGVYNAGVNAITDKLAGDGFGDEMKPTVFHKDGTATMTLKEGGTWVSKTLKGADAITAENAKYGAQVIATTAKGVTGLGNELLAKPTLQDKGILPE